MGTDDLIVLFVLFGVMWAIFATALAISQRETLKEYRETIAVLETTILNGSANPDWQEFFDEVRL